MNEHCPTCGSPVRVVTSGEGTSYYQPSERGDDAPTQAASRAVTPASEPPAPDELANAEQQVSSMHNRLVEAEAEIERLAKGQQVRDRKLERQRLEIADQRAEIERLTKERDAIGHALGEPCAECGHIDWRSDGYGEALPNTFR